jgi:arylsulfatase A-like enzyme
VRASAQLTRAVIAREALDAPPPGASGLRRNAALLLAALLLACGRGASPDVILITLDTTRVDHVGAYGYERDVTPALDSLAAEGVLYERAWSTAPWTLPAHASMFTGKHPTSHGAHFNAEAGEARLSEAIDPRLRRQSATASQIKVNRLGESAVTLAELLRERGYATAAFVGGPWLAPVFGLLQGYETQHATVDELSGRPANELTDAAIAWLEAVPPERPVHLLLNYFDPHSPYAPPRGYDDFPHARTPLVWGEDAVIRSGRLPAEQRRAYVDRYDGEIRFMDHHLGRLLQALRAAGRYDSALILVVADHGETFGEHGLFGHARWLYEELLRVPLVIRFPHGRDGGTAVSDQVSVVDLLPVVAAEVGFELPPDVEGVPLGQRELVLAEVFRDALGIRIYGKRFDRELAAAIRWPWKLLLDDAGRAELYDLSADPAELRDRTGAAQEVALREALAAARAALVPPATQAAAEVTPETHKRLRELGYVE